MAFHQQAHKQAWGPAVERRHFTSHLKENFSKVQTEHGIRCFSADNRSNWNAGIDNVPRCFSGQFAGVTAKDNMACIMNDSYVDFRRPKELHPTSALRSDLNAQGPLDFENVYPKDHNGKSNSSQIRPDGTWWTQVDGPLRTRAGGHISDVPRKRRDHAEEFSTGRSGMEKGLESIMARKARINQENVPSRTNGYYAGNKGNKPYKKAEHSTGFHFKFVESPSFLRFVKTVPLRPASAPTPAQLHDLCKVKREDVKKNVEKDEVKALDEWAPPVPVIPEPEPETKDKKGKKKSPPNSGTNSAKGKKK